MILALARLAVQRQPASECNCAVMRVCVRTWLLTPIICQCYYYYYYLSLNVRGLRYSLAQPGEILELCRHLIPQGASSGVLDEAFETRVVRSLVGSGTLEDGIGASHGRHWWSVSSLLRRLGLEASTMVTVYEERGGRGAASRTDLLGGDSEATVRAVELCVDGTNVS